MRFVLFYFASIACVFLIFYFSWVPSPRLTLLGYLPEWLANWVDSHQNENLRTGVPFVPLGLLTGYWIVKHHRTWHWWVIAWGTLLGIVVIAELGQLVLPLRHFDWADIGWGAVGAFLGLLFSAPLTLFPIGGKRTQKRFSKPSLKNCE